MLEDFRRQFLTEIVEKLENLRTTLQRGGDFSQTFRHETFRLLHTVKGTAQTFGFEAASYSAHQLEALFADDSSERSLLLEGIVNLEKSLTEETFQISEQSARKLNAQHSASDSSLTIKPPEFPAEYYNSLSKQEKKSVSEAIRSGKSLAVLEAEFATAVFACELINFKNVLNSAGEIIAVFPGAKLTDKDIIGFRFLLASAENVETLARENSATILWNLSPSKSADKTNEILQEIVNHGAKLAERLNKEIIFETQYDETCLSSDETKLVFEILLHLVRNAADHAIEQSGKIGIRIRKGADGLRLTVADDGCGIDWERVETLTTAKNPSVFVENINKAEAVDLIFQPEFSTKTEISEISGRGIGLNVVKCAVEEAGGTIKVLTEKGKGTTFEIFLPK